MNQSLSYKDAGVDIDAGDALVERIKPLARRTMREGVLTGIGGFGALFEVPRRFREPVLVSGTDGVGTKLKLAQQLGLHGTIGVDLVAMCVNDVLVQGAEPLFFLDYYATGKLELAVAERVIAGIAEGCHQAGCALVGGETAEMPGMYAGGDYDLAGFCVGIVEKDRLLDGSRTRAGDVVIGLASSGPHSNGYSLIRVLLERTGADEGTEVGGRSLLDQLLTPTRIYVKSVLDLMSQLDVHGVCHVTGGGLVGNLPRVLPAGLEAHIDGAHLGQGPLWQWIQQAGHITQTEMLSTFNCGIGLTLQVAAADADAALRRLAELGESAEVIGEIRQGNREVVVS